MTVTPKKPVRQNAIIEQLRGRIVDGKLLPGARLSTRLQLAEQFDTTVVTVQRALTRLTDEGFITPSGSRGTFVSQNPPHLSHYGLVFGYRPPELRYWTGFSRAMRDAAFAIERTEARRLSIYFHLNYDFHITEDYQQLLEGVSSHTLAGLIFVESPHHLLNSPVIKLPGIPRVAVMSQPSIPGVAAAMPNLRRFYDTALDHLYHRGRRRVALITAVLNDPLVDHVREAIARRGMQIQPYGWQQLSQGAPMCAENAAHLLFHHRQTERPDALIIGDDEFALPAHTGLSAAGMRIGEDLDVVSHCNFPLAGASHLPFKWLGFDAAEILHQCMQYIDTARRGGTPRNVTISPRFQKPSDQQSVIEPENLPRILPRKRHGTFKA